MYAVIPVPVPSETLHADPFVVGVAVLSAVGLSRNEIVARTMQRGASQALCEHEVDRALQLANLAQMTADETPAAGR